MSKLFSLLFVFVLLFLSFSLSFSQISDTVGVVDTLRVGSSTAYPGSQAIVPVYAFNDEPLGAMVVPLKFSSSDLSCDSVSFVGTRAADIAYKGAEIDSVNRTIKIYAITFTQIDPGSGLVAKVYFGVKDSALPQTVEIDTFSSANPYAALSFTYLWAVEMVPQFVKGAVVIKEMNLPPQILPIDKQYVSEGDTLSIRIVAGDPEGDPLKMSLLNAPEGAFFADSGNGRAYFRWSPPLTGPWSSVNSPFKVTFVASDGSNTTKEDVLIYIIDKKTPGPKDYILEISADSGFYSDVITIPVKLTNPDSVGTMKLLLSYDPTAISLLDVRKSNTRISDWEYFQSSQPNPGELKITGVADIPVPPSTSPLAPGEGTVVNLDFKIILDPSPLSLSSSIGFKFADSTDNTLSGPLGFNFVGQNSIQYQDGYVYIQNLVTLLGDINLNGIPYEIGDAIRFTNFLTDPVKYAFNEQQKRNSDVNQDGICCSLADFIVLLDKILNGGGSGLAKLLPQVSSAQVNVKQASSALDLYVDSEVRVAGAMFVINHPGIVLGAPVLSPEAKEMNLMKRDYPGETRLLIYCSPKTRYLGSGRRHLLSLPVMEGEGNVELSSAVLADEQGNLVQAKVFLESNNDTELPDRFVLFQNYPNPFNPQTNISFSLPEESEVSLKIYNLKGQLVKVLVNQTLTPGVHTLTWDGKDTSGNDLPSGIYFYKLNAGRFSDTRKMVRVK